MTTLIDLILATLEIIGAVTIVLVISLALALIKKIRQTKP